MQGGRLVAAAQEERFSRIKNDKAFPGNAFRYCLDQSGLTIADIDCVAFYEDPSLKLGRQIWMGMLPGLAQKRRASILGKTLWTRPESEIRLVTGYDGPIEIVDHHLSHAASAYFFSGFEEAAILTVDGVGEWPTTTYNSARAAEITRLEQVDFPHSLGLFYSAVTGYLGFEVNEGEYKVMGLAPYGQPKYANEIRQLIEEGPNGDYRLNLKYFSFLQEDKMFSEDLCELLGRRHALMDRRLLSFTWMWRAARSLSWKTYCWRKFAICMTRVPSENLCMAGGVALNVVANSRCLKEGPFKRLFVQPAAGDAGGCLGAAAVAHVRKSGARPCQERMQHAYLGPSNTVREIWHILNSSGVEFHDYRDNATGLIDDVVEQADRRAGGSMGIGPHGIWPPFSRRKIYPGRSAATGNAE